MIIFVWIQDNNHGFAKNCEIPWKYPKDLEFFQKITANKNILMGRKTADTLSKPLINRVNYVITRNISYKKDGFLILNDPMKVLELSAKEDFYIIGGVETFKLFLKYWDKCYVTTIKKDYDCDKFMFPILPNHKVKIYEDGELIFEEYSKL